MTQPSLKLVRDVFFALTRHLDTPVSLGAWLRFKYGEYHQLVTMDISPNDYIEPAKFRSDYLAIEYLSKYPDFDLPIDTTLAAFDAFNNAEKQCHTTNHRLKFTSAANKPAHVSSIIQLASRKISNLLGPINHKWLDQCKWGPGATFSLSSGKCSLGNKICEDQISITSSAIPFFRAAIGYDFQWLRARGIDAVGPVSLLLSEFKIVEGCRYTTVPKNAKTDRNIAIEPTANQFLQGGVGLYIRSKLRKVGIDLTTQSNNQKAAREAFSRDYATVDLSAASDTISTELVWQLLPFHWAELLDRLRSHKIRLSKNDSFQTLEKFSSMGNGFTFELETLIFWALTQATCEYIGDKNRVIVYGDDIITTSKSVPLLTKVFDFCGFTINKKKTHFGSPFRESCGVHFFNGLDVTPIYLRSAPVNPSVIHIMHNQLVRLSQMWLGYSGCQDKTFRAAVLRCRTATSNRYLIPLYADGDDGLLACQNEVGAIHPNGRKLRVLSAIPIRYSTDSAAMLSYWMRFIGGNQKSSSLLFSLPDDCLKDKNSVDLSNLVRFSIPYRYGVKSLLDERGKISKRDAVKYFPRKRKFHAWEGGEVLWV